MGVRSELEPRYPDFRFGAGFAPSARESPAGVNLNAKGEQLPLCRLSG